MGVAEQAGAGRCRACGGPCEPWFDGVSGEPRDPRRYPVMRCTGCGSGSTATPVAADAHATGAYSQRPPRLRRAIERLQRLLVRQPVALLRSAGVAPGGDVLDAGAGTGSLVLALRGAGYRARGIDSSSRSVAAATARGAPVGLEPIESHQASDLAAAVLWHVLEHLDEPRAALEHVRRWLGPDGTVLLAVPNVGSLQARIAGPAWFHLDLPRHRTHFTLDGLSRTIADAGLRPRGRARHLVFEQNFQGMWFALLTRLGMTPGFPFHLLKRNVDVRAADLALLLVAGPLLLPIAVALEALAALMRRGGTVAVLAQRR